MTLLPPLGTPAAAAPLELWSRDLLSWDAALAEWSPDSGAILALSGHVGTWSRGATLASVADATGATYTAQASEPAWEQRDWTGDSVRDSFGLRMGTDDRLAWPTSVQPQAMAGLLEIIETGARTTSGATLFALRAANATGAGLWLDTSGTYYRMNYSDGSTTRTATLTSGQPTSGQRVRFTWQLASTGALTFRQSINGAAATEATAAALALPSAWPSDAAWRLNSRGASANPGQGWYRRVRVVAGALDEAVIAERR
jgi:hypothetical protein